MRRLALAVLLVPSFSFAADNVTVSRFPPSPGVLPGGGFEFKSNSTFADPPPQRAWTNGVYGSVPGAQAGDSLTVRGPVGDLPVKVKRTMTNKAIGKAAARAAARAIPVVGQGLLIWDIYDGLRIRPDGSGGLATDDGQDPFEVPMWKCGDNIAASPTAACLPLWSSASSGRMIESAYACDAFSASDSSVSCNGQFHEPGYGSYFWNRVASRVPGKQCPAVIDFSDPRYSVPGGPVGFDQKCPTGRYNRPISFDDAATRFAAYPPVDPSAVARDAVDRGEQIDASPGGIEGPASQIGQPTVRSTTNPDGSIRTETKTPTYNFGYGPNSVTWTVTNTTIINNAGDVTTITETPPPATQEDPEDPCVGNPDRVGCAKMDAPSGPDLDTQEKPVSVTPDGGWGGDGGSCPAPLQTTVLGTPVVVDNTLFCQFLSGIRFAVIGVCGLIATLIFVGGFKES